MAAAVVPDRHSDVLGYLVDFTQKLLDGLTGQPTLALQCFVQIVHISLVMAIMMNLHRQGIDMGFEGVIGIRQGWQSVGHGVPPDAKVACI